jgi:hypothetical protein
MGACRYKMAGAAVAALLLTLVLATSASANPPSEIVIPAGYVATISNAAFGDSNIDPGNCPADRLEYGYELNSSPNVQLDSGVGCAPAAGATIGPFPAPTQLRIYLDDFSCSTTSAAPPPNVFYSDGVHALVTPVNPLTWGVSLMDSYLCTSGPNDPRAPAGPGTGNFNLTITLTPGSPGAICAATKTLVTGSPAYQSASFLSRGYASLLIWGACIAIDRVSGPPGPRNAWLIAQYDGYVAVLVRRGLLTATDGAYLVAAAGVL